MRNEIASFLRSGAGGRFRGERRRLGRISRQGNFLLRFLLVEAAQVVTT